MPARLCWCLDAGCGLELEIMVSGMEMDRMSGREETTALCQLPLLP